MIRMVKWLIVCLVGGLFVLSSNSTAAAAQSQEKSTTVSGVIRDHWEVTGQNAQGQNNIGNTNAGFVGVGTTNPTAPLDVAGGIALWGVPQLGAWNSRIPLATTITVLEPTSTDSSITIGVDGLPVIGHIASGLRVVKCTNSTCTGGTISTLVDPLGSDHISIAIGSDGLPVISYYDMSNTDLKVAKCGTPACSSGNTITTVDAQAIVGFGTSLVIGTDGLPVISYLSYTNADLKLVKCGDLACSTGNTISVVDGTDVSAAVGADTSLAIGVDGLPVIAYQSSASNLKVAKCGDGTCSVGNTFSLVDPSPLVGRYASLVIGADGLPIISYLDDTNADLKVVHCGDVSCASGNSFTIVDAVTNGGGYTSMALGSDGLPVISYRDEANADLKVAKCGTPQCNQVNTIVTVDSPSGSGAGRDTSIAVGADGLPVISYREESIFTSDNLRVAHCGSENCLPYWTRR